MSRDERRINIKDAFSVKLKPRADSVYILVDDVYTTGATLEEACRVLKKAGAKVVWGMVVAVG